MPPPEILAFVAVAFLIAGVFKGVTGLGLPAMSLGLLLLAIDLKQAMVILVVPLLATNIWQGMVGGHFGAAFRRFWTLFLAGALGIWFAVGVMVETSSGALAVVLGVVLFAYAVYGLMAPQVPPPGRWEGVLSPLAGAATGVIGGFTGSMAVPFAPYMQALGMDRDALIQAMGVWFSISALMLGVALGGRGALPRELMTVSAGAVVPAIVGMEAGRWVRRRLSDALFRKVFFAALALLGVYIALRGLFLT